MLIKCQPAINIEWEWEREGERGAWKEREKAAVYLKRGKPCSELPRWVISISELSCSCAATTTLQGGTSEEEGLWIRSQAEETLIFQPVWKSGDNLMLEQPTKRKEERKGERESLRERKKFHISLRRTEFYTLFEAGCLIIHLILQASSKAVWEHRHAWCDLLPALHSKLPQTTIV